MAATHSSVDLLHNMNLMVQFSKTQKEAVEKIVEYCKNLKDIVSTPLANTILVPILDVKGDKKKVLSVLDVKSQTWLTLAETVDQFSAEGYGGITIIDDDISPIMITRDVSVPADKEEENTIVKKLMDAIMEKYEMESVTGHVLLFSTKGFSGDMHYVVRVKQYPKEASSLASLFGGGIKVKNSLRRAGKKRK